MQNHPNTIPFSELLIKLKKEHKPEYVYRGQTKEWPGPLVPSMFRPFVPDGESFSYSGDDRLRQYGTAFIEELSMPEILTHNDEQAIFQLQKRINVGKELRILFGYPFCQIFSQQAGLSSEGLDVTSDIDIAAFFATHDLINKVYTPSISGEGIIYRFIAKNDHFSLSNMKTLDYYSCPPFISSFDLIQLFEECCSIDESIQSLIEYKMEHTINSGMDPSIARHIRPFESIKFPSKTRQLSRIVQQRAGLLIPDMLLTEYWSNIEIQAPRGKTNKKGQPCIEDLKKRMGVSIFRFEHNQNNSKLLNILPKQVFPENDIICYLLRFLLSRTFGRDIYMFNDMSIFPAIEDYSSLVF